MLRFKVDKSGGPNILYITIVCLFVGWVQYAIIIRYVKMMYNT